MTQSFGWTDTSIDFGFARGLALGDYVWNDADGEGDQDSNERGIANVLVELYARNADVTNPNVAPLASTRTTADGFYVFSSAGNNTVQPNTLYTIVISLAKNTAVLGNAFQPTVALNNGADDTAPSDSNGVLNGARTHLIAIASSGNPGESKTAYDFGFVPVICLGDFVWNDANGDGLQTSGEKGNQNVGVQLYRTLADGTRGTLVCETTTNSNGIWTICSNSPSCSTLVPSTTPYQLVTRLSDTPNRRCTYTDVNDNANDATDSDAVKVGNECVITFNVPRPGFNSTSLDIGLINELLIGDRVFRDSNFDGLDGTLSNRETELGIRDVELLLLRNGLQVYLY